MRFCDIRPIPKNITKKIIKLDKLYHPEQNRHTRYYAYFTKYNKELVKVTVAVKTQYKQQHLKQVAIHGIHSPVCFVKDLIFTMIAGYRTGWFDMGLDKYPKWFEDGKWGYNEDKYLDPVAEPVNVDYILTIPEYKYSAVDKYKYIDILKYLRIYEQYPQAELLVKADLSYLATKKQILNKTQNDKKFCKWLYKNKDEISDAYVSTILKAYNENKPVKEVQKFEERFKSFIAQKDLASLRNTFRGEYEKFFNYLDSQQTNYRPYQDYLNACTFLGIDMTISKNRYPHDFKVWHDIRINQYNTAKIKEDEKNRKKFYEKFKKIANKYLSLEKDNNDAFVILIAKSPKELINEGEILHHCVGKMGYDQKFAKEESLIFFVRNKDCIEKPFVTLEYSLSNHKILQIHGKHNSPPSENVLEYINKTWLPYANKKIKKLKEIA